MRLRLLFLFLFSLSTQLDMVKLKQWTSAQAHSELTTTVNIYNDNSRLVTGSSDNTVKVWSVENLNLIQTIPLSDDVTNVSLHPDDNRFFILLFDGNIYIYDPDTYLSVGSALFPGGGNGNYLRFYDSNTKFVVGGYDNGGIPVYHKFDAVTYTYIGAGGTTDFAAGDEITVMAMSRNQNNLAVISLNGVSPFTFNLFDFSTDTLLRTFTGNFGAMKWILFSPYNNQMYTVSEDKTLKIYNKNPSGDYDVLRTFFTDNYGIPNTLNSGIQDQLIIGTDNKIVFLNISQGIVPSVIQSYTDQANIFVLDLSLDQKYIVTGMQNGEVSLWEILEQQQSPYQLPTQVIAGIAIGGILLIIILIAIIYFCCCKRKKQSQVIADESHGDNRKKTINLKQLHPSEQNSLSAPNMKGFNY